MVSAMGILVLDNTEFPSLDRCNFTVLNCNNKTDTNTNINTNEEIFCTDMLPVYCHEYFK